MAVILCLCLFISENHAQDNSSNFRFGFTERTRFVTWDNAITLSDAADAGNTFTRHRTSIWGDWRPMDNLQFYAKFTNEFRYYFKPDNRDFDIHEIIFDNLYVKFTPSPSIPVTLTLGRQNIILGEGFVVMDGHPLDGSRSIYFNAARADVKLSNNDNLILFYTYQPTTDDILPLINDKNQALVEKPETGIGIYYQTKFDNSLSLHAYVINKKVDTTAIDSVEEKFNTFGARVNFPLTENISLTAEAAYQNGTTGSNNRNSYGGYAYLDYSTGFAVPLPKKVSAGVITLSGDDSSTKDVEGWDPIFSRWPKWSESYIYTQILENGGKVAYWSNFISIYGKLFFDISDMFNLDVHYHHMLSQYEMPSTSLLASGGGTTRGDLFIAKLNAAIDTHLTGHILLEHFMPGNFYTPSADGYTWFRCELMYNL